MRSIFVLFAPQFFRVIGQRQEDQTAHKKKTIRRSKRKCLELRQANVAPNFNLNILHAITSFQAHGLRSHAFLRRYSWDPDGLQCGDDGH